MEMKCTSSKLEEICDPLERFDDPSDISQREDLQTMNGRDNEAKISVEWFHKEVRLGAKSYLTNNPTAVPRLFDNDCTTRKQRMSMLTIVLIIDIYHVGPLKDEDEHHPRAFENATKKLGYFLHKSRAVSVCVFSRKEKLSYRQIRLAYYMFP